MAVGRDFQKFMSCVISVEHLTKLSSQTLEDFQQNLGECWEVGDLGFRALHQEVFRRPPLSKTSSVIAKVLTVASSARLTKYLEAGGLHEDPARLVAAKLDSALKGLWTHVRQVEALMEELETFKRRVSDLMELEFSSQLETLEISLAETESEDDFKASQPPAEPGMVESRLQTSDYVHLMSLILTMLTEDFKMQEKIVCALGLDTTMETLQSYTLMWRLRPLVDDLVVQQALNWIK